MPFNDVYRRQVDLLVRTLPYVAEEGCFALKGGTAINLFVRDLPRLSVDIDLTYLPVADRDKSLAEIDDALRHIGERIKSVMKGIRVTESTPATQQTINKLILRTPDRVQIKIEVTPVLRGCVYNPKTMTVCSKAEEQFGFAEISVLSFADLYAGKIMATLDRQHPRDLFDVYQLLENEGINDEMRTALIIYLISHDHSPHTLLSPAVRDVTHDYERNFLGMTEEDVAMETLLATRTALVDNIASNMSEDHKRFLVSFYRRKPDWSLLELDGLDQLPAVRWRELNLDRAGEDTRTDIVRKLEKVLW
ncbi:MAG: nucleotidyl transferase AbiEii/AbiGii toxin family protein [Proteobacteria bacterium]|nr:nucleotidyl transferase AbiEii/AbiGii toxin family protein [Pseudomonadota bacterium]